MRTSAHLLCKYAPAAVGMSRTYAYARAIWVESDTPGCLPCSMERATGRPRICFANPHRLRSANLGPGRRGGGRNRSNLSFPKSTSADGAGNGTSAHLLRKSAPAAVAYRRPCLLAINASRLFNARTLSGSSPGTLLKKAR